MLILLDQDGVLADFERGFFNNWVSQYPDRHSVPVPERQAWRLSNDYPPDWLEEVEGIYLAEGFYRNLPPVPGALEAVGNLLRLGHDVRICTSPLTQHKYCVPEKYQWVEAHLGPEFTQRMILTKDKTCVLGDILIDDRPDIVGTYNPVWKHYLYDAPYNRTTTGIPRITWQNWQEVLQG